MKLNKNHIQTFIFVIVYLFAIYFWSQPYQERKLPYGEYDAMSHFEVGDYMAYNDKSFVKLPPYIDLRYGNDNKFKPHTLWYPPVFHTSLGIMEVIGGERIVPIFLLNTLMASFVIVTVYFVINSLFGFLPAILSSLFIIFSPRDFMPYLWGQWPERFGYAFVPIILYCFYKYFISYSKEDSKTIYIYLTALFLGINILIHPLVFFHSVLGLVVLYVFLSIKQRKIVFNWKHYFVSILIFLILFLVFYNQTFNIFPRFGAKTVQDEQSKNNFELSRLLQWSLNPKDYEGSVPSNYFSFSEMNGLWSLPFLLIGILILLIRREERDLLLMAWLVSLYIVLHRDLIGKAQFLHRSLSASAHIFAPLTAIGAVYSTSLLKISPNLKKYIKYFFIAIMLYFVFAVNMANASKMLNKDTYNDFLTTLSVPQFEAAEWTLKNAPQEYNVSVLGIPHQQQFLTATSKKIRWFAAVSQHVSRFYYLVEDKEEAMQRVKNNYIVMDYTMLAAIGDRETSDKMQKFEKTTLTNHTLLYNKDNIRVYKLEPKR